MAALAVALVNRFASRRVGRIVLRSADPGDEEPDRQPYADETHRIHTASQLFFVVCAMKEV